MKIYLFLFMLLIPMTSFSEDIMSEVMRRFNTVQIDASELEQFGVDLTEEEFTILENEAFHAMNIEISLEINPDPDFLHKLAREKKVRLSVIPVALAAHLYDQSPADLLNYVHEIEVILCDLYLSLKVLPQHDLFNNKNLVEFKGLFRFYSVLNKRKYTRLQNDKMFNKVLLEIKNDFKSPFVSIRAMAIGNLTKLLCEEGFELDVKEKNDFRLSLNHLKNKELYQLENHLVFSRFDNVGIHSEVNLKLIDTVMDCIEIPKKSTNNKHNYYY